MDIQQAVSYAGVFGSLLIFATCIKSRSFIDFLIGLAFLVLFISKLASKGEPIYEAAEVVAGLSVLLIAALKLRTKHQSKSVDAR